MATAKEIGIGIKNARLTVGITQAELARRLGVTPQAISQYERGEKKPKIETIKKIADALGVSWFQLSHLDDLVATSEERVLDKEEVYQSIAVDYTTAELFVMASEPEASRVAFLNNVAMTIPEDASGCIDMDAEKCRKPGLPGICQIFAGGALQAAVKQKIPHFAYKVPRVARRASAKQGIFCKIKSGTAHRQCRSLQRP